MVGREDVGRFRHEVHPAEDDELCFVLLLSEHRQPERVAAGVGPSHHFLALVVVAEDEEPIAEGSLGCTDSGCEIVGVGAGVPLRQGGLDPQHRWVVLPFGETLWLRPVGTAWSPSTGMSAPELAYGAGDQAGVHSSVRSRRDFGAG